jgi:hypothetical protein
MGLHRLLLTAALVVVTGCGGAAQILEQKPDVRTSGSVLAPIAGKTYAYEATSPAPPGDAQWKGTQDSIAKVKEKCDAAMQAKGYVLSPKPQLMVRISIGLKTIKDPAAVRGAAVQTDTEQDLEIDVFDYASGKHLFHGTANDPLHHKQPSESKIAESVPAILQQVPPAS